MIVLVVSRLHSLKSIPMIGMFQSENHNALLLAAVHIILQGHFQGHLHSHAARIGEKGIVQIARQPALKPGREAQDGLVSKAAQHNMGEFFRLGYDGLIHFRMLIAMNYAPPGGDRINQRPVLSI